MYELMAAAEGWPATDWLQPWRPPAAADGLDGPGAPDTPVAPGAVDAAGSTGPTAPAEDRGHPDRGTPADPAEARGTVSP